MNRLLILITFALLFTAGGVAGQAAAAAQPAQGDQELIMVADLWTPPEQCPKEAVIDVALEKIARHSEQYEGKCVRTSGLWIGLALYSNLGSYYLTDARISNVPKTPYRIGLYGREKVVHAPEAQDVSFAKVIGKVGSCETFPGVAMMGYCHYARGAYIALASATLQPARLTRLTGERARHRFGNLEPLTQTAPERSIVEPIAARWMRDIQEGDVADFADLNGIPASEIDLNDEGSLLNAVFNAPDSSFADFRRRADAPAPTFFRVISVKRETEDEAGGETERDAEFVGCFCRRASCDDLWPIASFDAENVSTRPYVCLYVDRERHRGEWKETVRTEFDWRTFLDEPAPATRH